ncbi:unnamed protein product [Mytilus coruscus]|uniref:Uncharacterized protein n=1 Tax=Mytilus coruscus TaxID=42192 RepID=A0A6J8EBA7_MYTCO|nr:unnamed protein product [Mytilus coruscus]
MYVDKSFFNGLCATGFAVLCLSVCGNCFFIKFIAAISRRKTRNSDENENQDVLQGNSSNNDTANDTALGENDNVFSHYETINENELIGRSHPPTSQHLSNLPRVSNIVQSLKHDDMYLEVIEETNNQMLDPRTKINGDKDHVSSPREERNAARFIFSTKNEKDDKSNTIDKEFPVTIERNNFQDCKTSNNSISLSSSSTSEQSAGENIQERDKKASEHPNQYMSLNVNDMEYLNSYSTLITENKLRENESQNSNDSETPETKRNHD